MILAHSPRTMVSKLVASLVIIPAAVIWAAGPHAAVHPAPYAPVHPAPYAPAHPAPYAPAHHGYCDPKAPPKCAEGSDLPYCIVDKEYPAYDIANKISQDALFLKKSLTLLINQLMISSRISPSHKRNLLTTSTTLELPRDHLLMTLLIG